MRLLALTGLILLSLTFTGCETVEKPADSMLPQAAPASWQGGIPGMSTPGPGYR